MLCCKFVKYMGVCSVKSGVCVASSDTHRCFDVIPLLFEYMSATKVFGGFLMASPSSSRSSKGTGLSSQ